MKAHKLQMRVVSLKIKQTTSFFVLVLCVWAMFWVDRVKDGFKRKPVPDPILRIYLFHCCPRQRKAWCSWAVILVFTSCSSLNVRAGASSRSRPWPGGQLVQQWLVLLLPWPSAQLTTSSQVLEWILTKIRGLLWTAPSSGAFESVNMLFGFVAAITALPATWPLTEKTTFDISRNTKGYDRMPSAYRVYTLTKHSRAWQWIVASKHVSGLCGVEKCCWLKSMCHQSLWEKVSSLQSFACFLVIERVFFCCTDRRPWGQPLPRPVEGSA